MNQVAFLLLCCAVMSCYCEQCEPGPGSSRDELRTSRKNWVDLIQIWAKYINHLVSKSQCDTIVKNIQILNWVSTKAVGLSWLTRVSWVRNWLESLFLTLSQLESAYLQRYLHFGYHIFIFGIPEWEVGRRRKQENKWFVSSQKWYMLKCQ